MIKPICLEDGAYAILTTPFSENGKVDLDAMSRHVEQLCGTQIKGIIPCSTTGEFLNCTFEENKEIFTVVAEVTKSRKKLIGGATGADGLSVCRILDFISGLGYDAALTAPPYYYKHSESEVTGFFKSVGSAGFPVVAYQIPAFTTAISLSTYRSLLDFEHIIALKNSSANIKEIMHQIDLKNRLRPEFKIFAGTDDALVPCLAAGCNGSFTALGASLPDAVCDIYHLHRSGRFKESLCLQNKILPLLRLADSFSFPAGYKLLASANGFTLGEFRQSLPENTLAQMPDVISQMKEIISNL